MNLLKPLLIALAIILSTPAFAQDDLKKLILGMEMHNPVEYQSVMNNFIAAAKLSDIERMIALTSPITRKQQSDDSLRVLYREEYVALFTTMPDISDGGSNELIDRPTGEHGWIFTRTASGSKGKSAPIYVVVPEEDGQKYVTALGIKE